MPKKFAAFILGSFLLLCFSIFPGSVSANGPQLSCDSKFAGYVDSATFPAENDMTQPTKINVTFGHNADPGFNFNVFVSGQLGFGKGQFGDYKSGQATKVSPGDTKTFQIPAWNYAGDYTVKVVNDSGKPGGIGSTDICKLGTITFTDPSLKDIGCDIKMPQKIKNGDLGNGQTDGSNPLHITTTVNNPGGPLYYFLHIIDASNNDKYEPKYIGSSPQDFPPTKNFLADLPNGGYSAKIEVIKSTTGVKNPNYYDQNFISGIAFKKFCSTLTFTIGNDPTDTTYGQSTTDPTANGISSGPDLSKYDCKSVAPGDNLYKYKQCSNAAGISCNTTTGAYDISGTGILTSIGCIPTSPNELIAGFLRFASFISGGIALLMMSFAAFGMITSGGNGEHLKHAQERFYSAIIGLLFIIFAVLFLQFLGVDILNIPGFGR